LKVQYPTLDVNELYIDMSNFNQDNKSAVVRTNYDSLAYAQKTATIIAGYTKAVDFTYTNPTLTQANYTSGNAVYKYKGGAALTTGVAYTSVGTIAAPVVLDAANGNVTLTTNTYFAGGMYTIKATYTDVNNIQ
jgi:hypothetical protein